MKKPLLKIMTTKKPPLEKDIEKKICDYARSLKVLVYKFTSPNQRAVPDRMFIAPNGRIGFLEIKRQGCAPTKLQTKEMAKLKQQGCTVSWIDNVPDGKAFVAELVVQSQCGTPGGAASLPLCKICKRPMLPDDDCGGDCRSCMATCGDPPYYEHGCFEQFVQRNKDRQLEGWD